MISMSTHLLLGMSTHFLHLKSELQLKSKKQDDDDRHDDDLVAALPVRLPSGAGVGGSTEYDGESRDDSTETGGDGVEELGELGAR